MPLEEEIVPQTTLRDALSANFEAADAGVLETQVADRPRDEAGRFAPKQAEAPVQEAPVVAPVVAPVEPELQRPTTWKKDYLPIWDKLATGQVLTPEEAKKLAQYSNQRETEYKTGVSTYKAEAQNARELQESITPFLPELQANGIKPADWVKQMGQAHYVLVKGSPDQKLQMFQEIARQYGVPIAAIQHHNGAAGLPPLVADLMQQLSDLKQQVSGVNTWKSQLEVGQLQSEVQRFAGDTQTYPHFEKLREPMAQLLESGAARDLPTAYKMAERMDDELFDQRLNQALDQRKSTTAQVVSQAKAKAISPKSSTPRGQATAGGPKDRRAILSEALDAVEGGRV